VEPFRARLHEPEGHALRAQLGEWAKSVTPRISGVYPKMPEGVNDRPADVWEPLLTVADAAGANWPKRARAACLELLGATTSESVSLGVRLLMDVRTVFGMREAMFTTQLLDALHAMPDAPWAELGGKGLNAYSLSKLLRGYEIGPKNVYVDGNQNKGYERAAFADAWARYCSASRTGKPSYPSYSSLPRSGGVQDRTDTSERTDRSVLRTESVSYAESPTSTNTDRTDRTGFGHGGVENWPRSEGGNCIRCGARTHRYGVGGNPLCAECRSGAAEDEAA